MTDWARSYFESGYAQRWSLSGPSERTASEVAYLWDQLHLRPHSLVLDIGCGHGKYACALARRGARAVGVDLSSTLLNRAQQLASELAINVPWIRGDMRFLPVASAKFAAVIVLDAFGFFDRDEENESVLCEITRVLVPGGRVTLKVVNAEPVLSGFRATDREEHDGIVVELARTITSHPTQLIESVTIDGPSGSRAFQRRQRLYRPSEFFASVESAGLSVASISASISSNAPFDAQRSPTIVVLAERRRTTD